MGSTLNEESLIDESTEPSEDEGKEARENRLDERREVWQSSGGVGEREW